MTRARREVSTPTSKAKEPDVAGMAAVTFAAVDLSALTPDALRARMRAIATVLGLSLEFLGADADTLTERNTVLIRTGKLDINALIGAAEELQPQIEWLRSLTELLESAQSRMLVVAARVITTLEAEEPADA